ncbi:hypothetical protein EOB59_31975 [Mesorhizobium sp. M7A.F.Ca.MR.176.00.0.0]|nr:hypothetical protein EOB59_31975 [Mesorhizobium sp. M7A.F.Ca.MR.176.00.0.0]
MRQRLAAKARRYRIERADDQAANNALVVGFLQNRRIAENPANVTGLVEVDPFLSQEVSDRGIALSRIGARAQRGNAHRRVARGNRRADRRRHLWRALASRLQRPGQDAKRMLQNRLANVLQGLPDGRTINEHGLFGFRRNARFRDCLEPVDVALQRRGVAGRVCGVVGPGQISKASVDIPPSRADDIAQVRQQLNVAAARGDGIALTVKDLPKRLLPVLEPARRLVEHVLIAHLPEPFAGPRERICRALPKAFEPGQVLQIVLGERCVVGAAQPFRQARRGRQDRFVFRFLDLLLKDVAEFLHHRQRRNRVPRGLAELIGEVEIAGHGVGLLSG